MLHTMAQKQLQCTVRKLVMKTPSMCRIILFEIVRFLTAPRVFSRTYLRPFVSTPFALLVIYISPSHLSRFKLFGYSPRQLRNSTSREFILRHQPPLYSICVTSNSDCSCLIHDRESSAFQSTRVRLPTLPTLSASAEFFLYLPVQCECCNVRWSNLFPNFGVLRCCK